MESEVLPVVKECLENAQAVRMKLVRDESALDGIPGPLAERIERHERMLTYLLGAIEYLARSGPTVDATGRSILFDQPDENFAIEGIGPIPFTT